MSASSVEVLQIDSALPRHLSNGEEIWGTLHSIQSQGEDALVQIGQRDVLLPQGAVSEALLGQRVAVLRLDSEYFVRGMDHAGN